MSEVIVASAKAVPVAGRLPRTNGRSQLTQFLAVRNALNPARLPSGANRPLKRTEVVLKRESEVNAWRLARSPLVTRETQKKENDLW